MSTKPNPWAERWHLIIGDVSRRLERRQLKWRQEMPKTEKRILAISQDAQAHASIDRPFQAGGVARAGGCWGADMRPKEIIKKLEELNERYEKEKERNRGIDRMTFQYDSGVLHGLQIALNLLKEGHV